jgi:putative acetyltransferase
MNTRSETPADHCAIRDLVSAAFGRPDEAELVDRLRASGHSVVGLVALDGDAIVGHILFSRMIAPFRALGLGPVSVLPNRQRMGIGSGLIREGLRRTAESGWRGVFVVGDPRYYRRFGFDPALAAGFTCRYSGPHFMVHALGAVLPATEGAVEYAPAFSG